MKKLLACLFSLTLAIPFLAGNATAQTCDEYIRQVEAKLASMGESPAKKEIEGIMLLAQQLANDKNPEGDLAQCEIIAKDCLNMIAKLEQEQRRA